MTENAQPNDDDIRIKLYGETRADLLKRQLSNSENADRAILTVSTAALGFSLAFLKDIVPVQTADCALLLYLSWLFFPAAIIATMLSFFTSQKAITEQIEIAHKYYIERDEKAYNLKSKYNFITEILNHSGAVLLVAGLLVTCIYVVINLGKEKIMSNKQINEGATTPQMQITPHTTNTLQKGATIPSMQKVPMAHDGAPVPSLQKVPNSAPVTSPVTPKSSR